MRLDHIISPNTPTCRTRESTGRAEPVGRKLGLLLEQPDLLTAPIETLARRCGVSEATVYAAIRDAGGRREKTKKELILGHPKLGEWSSTKIAEAVGCSASNVRMVMRDAGIQTERMRRIEERAGRRFRNWRDKLMHSWRVPDGWKR